jgi:tetratricopeptide (TPR) repeat protein
MAKYCIGKAKHPCCSPATYGIIIIFLISLFSSCSSNYLKACYENLSAIYLSEKGETDKAVITFGKASDNIDKNKYKKYVEYNIAFLYREIGEPDAAELKFLSIDADNDSELKYRIDCELGIIAFQKGDYEKAAGLFRNAILINNNDIKLIQNLELALLLMNEDKKKKGESLNYILPAGDNKAAEDAEKLLNIMFSGEDLFWTENTIGKTERGKDW